MKIRAAMQVIPYVGGALDTLFSEKGAQIQQQRIAKLLENLDSRLNRVEKARELPATEEFFDLMLAVFERVVRTRSQAKIERFANLVSKQAIELRPWEDVEAAVRLLGELDDYHLWVLREIASAPVIEGGSSRRANTLLEPIVELTKDPQGPFMMPLTLRFPSISPAKLRLLCAELLSKGLLQDEGIGRWGVRAMEMFTPTDLADWFIGWIESAPDVRGSVS
jgi:hypothetical protein